MRLRARHEGFTQPFGRMLPEDQREYLASATALGGHRVFWGGRGTAAASAEGQACRCCGQKPKKARFSTVPLFARVVFDPCPRNSNSKKETLETEPTTKQQQQHLHFGLGQGHYNENPFKHLTKTN